MTNLTYNPNTRLLIFSNENGSPIGCLAGPIAEQVYNRMCFANGIPVFMSKNQLENKINELNHWLEKPQNAKHVDYLKTERFRVFYVNKIINLEVKGLEKIKVL